MRVGIYSINGECSMLLRSLVHHAHEPVVYIADPDSRRIADGIAWKVDDPNQLLQSDVIVFDDNGKGNVADLWRSYGKAVWCGGKIADRLETDRAFGMKTFAECGIPIPQTYEVSGLADVKSILKSEFDKGDKVVIKLDDSSQCSMSYIAPDTKGLIEQVEHWEQDAKIKIPWTGILQRFVEGVEVSVEGWWTGTDWLFPNVTFEEKKAWTGNLGPAVGCSFNVVASISANSRLFSKMVAPLGEFLKEAGYVGQIDVNTIVSQDGPNALEFTPRPGYDATPTLSYSRHGGFGGMVLEAISGEIVPANPGVRPDGPFKPDLFAAGVRVSVPPYPFEAKSDKLSKEAHETCLGVPLDLSERDLEHFYLYDVMCGERGFVCAGTLGVIGIAMGHGDSPRSAGKAAYRVADGLKIPNKQYRAIDGWHRAEKDCETLIETGWIRL